MPRSPGLPRVADPGVGGVTQGCRAHPDDLVVLRRELGQLLQQRLTGVPRPVVMGSLRGVRAQPRPQEGLDVRLGSLEAWPQSIGLGLQPCERCGEHAGGIAGTAERFHGLAQVGQGARERRVEFAGGVALPGTVRPADPVQQRVGRVRLGRGSRGTSRPQCSQRADHRAPGTGSRSSTPRDARSGLSRPRLRGDGVLDTGIGGAYSFAAARRCFSASSSCVPMIVRPSDQWPQKSSKACCTRGVFRLLVTDGHRHVAPGTEQFGPCLTDQVRGPVQLGRIDLEVVRQATPAALGHLPAPRQERSRRCRRGRGPPDRSNGRSTEA